MPTHPPSASPAFSLSSTNQADHAACLAHVQNLCREHDATLLFLTVFGSTLYGTASPGVSDVDLRGVFLPSVRSLVLNEAPESLHLSTGNAAHRNTSADVDVDLVSLQRWLLHLLPAGDMGALDLLFAPSHPACTLYQSPVLDAVFANPLRLVNTASGSAHVDYVLRQAKKYGIKGSRLGALRRVWHWLEAYESRARASERDVSERDASGRLLDVLDELAAACADERFCRIVATGNGRGLHLCGKVHQGNVSLVAFSRRVVADMQRDGTKALEAERNEGLDFKALSHAVRALDQMEELLHTGRVVFPLRTRANLRAIRAGRFTWLELEPLILERLRVVNALKDAPPCTGAHDMAFAKACLLQGYALSS